MLFSFLALCQSTQSSERVCEQSKQPSELEGKQSKKASEKGGGQSRQPSGRAGEQSEQPSEPETPHDVFSLLEEVQKLRRLVTGLEKQPKEHEVEQGKPPTRREGEQSKQWPSEHETADDMFSLLAEIRDLTKIAIERKDQKTD